MVSPAPPAVDLEGVRLTHPGGWALDCPSILIKAGERVALAGPSGAGKTTLLRTLAGLHPAAAGRPIVAGEFMAALGERARRAHRLAHLGVVFQRFGLLPHLNAVENVLLPRRLGAGDGPLGAADRERARGLLEAVGLADRVGHKPGALSVGEQQRVAVCRALIHRPRLVLADEPTASLDEAAAERVVDLLLAEADTLVCVSHDPALVARCDRVIRL